MNPVTHIIERQVLDLTLDTDHEAQVRQKTARRVVRDRVLLVLDEVFTRLAGPDRVIRLDRLDLDLGVLPADGWAEQLVERLREHVEQELGRYAHAAPYGDSSATSKTVAQSQLEAFMVFLDTGGLPWWVPDAASFDPGAELLDLIVSQPEALRTALRSRYRPDRVRRLVLQVHPEVIKHLHVLLAPAAAVLIKQVQRAWQQLAEADWAATGGRPPSQTQVETAMLDLLLATGASATITERKLYEAIGRQMATQAGSVEDLARTIALLPETEVTTLEASEAGPLVVWLRETTAKTSALPAARHRESDETKDRQRALKKGTASPTAETQEKQRKVKRGDTALQQEEGASAEAYEAAETGPSSPPSEEETIEGEAEPSSIQQRAREAVDGEHLFGQKPFESVEAHSLEGQAFYVTNAGLVLLWPFLGRFFKKMELVEDKAFRTPAFQQRAILLTHYLVTGETEAPEQVLLLNKILCGWPPDASIPKAIELTPEERDESQVLLEAAVTQWAALKNTSVAGLQQAFLQRDGRLLKQPDAWTLKVDRTGYDVLLDRLPWSIAIIKQPWMAYPLFVEW